jgi:hypothetical protein
VVVKIKITRAECRELSKLLGFFDQEGFSPPCFRVSPVVGDWIKIDFMIDFPTEDDAWKFSEEFAEKSRFTPDEYGVKYSHKHKAYKLTWYHERP